MEKVKYRNRGGEDSKNRTDDKGGNFAEELKWDKVERQGMMIKEVLDSSLLIAKMKNPGFLNGKVIQAVSCVVSFGVQFICPIRRRHGV